MKEVKKYAILDTDFISKTYMIQNETAKHLVDFFMEHEEYEFFCHEKTVDELSRHTIGDSDSWLAGKIADGSIHCFSDQDIITELSSVYGNYAKSAYVNFLKVSCDAFEAGYFQDHFSSLLRMDDTVSNSAFITELQRCDAAIGEGKSLGEKKSLILIQLLKFLHPGKVEVFCSDDSNARKSIISIGEVSCISVLSLFYELMENGVAQIEAEPYFSQYETWCRSRGQNTFKVIENSREHRVKRVDCRQVFYEIYSGKYQLLTNGYLQYKE